MPDPAVRPHALLLRVIDGDTYTMAVDLLNEGGSGELWPRYRFRLRDYSARESKDVAPDDPLGLGRSTGPEAKAAAERLFTTLPGFLMVEPHGLDPHGRPVAWVWFGDVSLGQTLAAEGHVALLKRKG